MEKPDQLHHHEALDRLHIICTMVEDFLMFHPAVEANADVKNLVLLAVDGLGKAYQLVGAASAQFDGKEPEGQR